MSETAAVSTYQSIPLSQIRPSTHQARKTFDEDSLKTLADSMKAEGLIQPLTVRSVVSGNVVRDTNSPLTTDHVPHTTQFELVSGERRLRAARLLGWETIDARIIQTVSEAESAAKGLVENLQREDLNPIEEAEGIQALLDLHDSHWTQEEIGKVVGKSQSEISRTIRFLDLSDQIKENMRRRIISVGHAVELLRLPKKELQAKVADKIKKKKLSRDQTRAVVDNLVAKAAGKDAPSKQPPTGLKKDPVAALWPEIKLDLRMASVGSWKVDFKKGQWIFTVNSAGVSTQEALATWFRQVGEALGKPVPAPSGESDSEDVTDSPYETASVEAMQKRASLPKTAKEEAELYALAAKSKGPAPIYAKIYGPMNPLTRVAETMTWAQFQVTDPKEALRQLLDSIRKAQGVKP